MSSPVRLARAPRRALVCALPCAAALCVAPACAAAQLQPTDASFWSAAAAVLAGTAAGDPWLRRELRGSGGNAGGTAARLVQPLGLSRTAYVGLGASFVGAALRRDPGWARATLRVAAGFVAADAVTSILKPVVGRARPYTERGAFHFHAFAPTDRDHAFAPTDRDHAFASGHATHAFAIAAGVAGEAHRPWVTAAAYGTAALVGWSRVHDDAHWTSDVVAGALVGTSASLTTRHWLDRRFRRRPPADSAPALRLTVMPRGLAVAFPF